MPRSLGQLSGASFQDQLCRQCKGFLQNCRDVPIACGSRSFSILVMFFPCPYNFNGWVSAWDFFPSLGSWCCWEEDGRRAVSETEESAGVAGLLLGVNDAAGFEILLQYQLHCSVQGPLKGPAEVLFLHRQALAENPLCQRSPFLQQSYLGPKPQNLKHYCLLAEMSDFSRPHHPGFVDVSIWSPSGMLLRWALAVSGRWAQWHLSVAPSILAHQQPWACGRFSNPLIIIFLVLDVIKAMGIVCMFWTHNFPSGEQHLRYRNVYCSL